MDRTHFLPGILSRAADVDLAIGPQFGQSRSHSPGKLIISGRMQCAVSLHGSIIDFVYLCYSLCFSVDNPSFERDHMPIFGIMNQHQAGIVTANFSEFILCRGNACEGWMEFCLRAFLSDNSSCIVTTCSHHLLREFR